MAAIKSFEIECACGRKKLPFSVLMSDDPAKGPSTREFICPFSHSGQCSYPNQLQQVQLPGGIIPDDWIPKTIKKID